MGERSIEKVIPVDEKFRPEIATRRNGGVMKAILGPCVVLDERRSVRERGSQQEEDGPPSGRHIALPSLGPGVSPRPGKDRLVVIPARAIAHPDGRRRITARVIRFADDTSKRRIRRSIRSTPFDPSRRVLRGRRMMGLYPVGPVHLRCFIITRSETTSADPDNRNRRVRGWHSLVPTRTREEDRTMRLTMAAALCVALLAGRVSAQEETDALDT
jgi:hypothetical protein